VQAVLRTWHHFTASRMERAGLLARTAVRRLKAEGQRRLVAHFARWSRAVTVTKFDRAHHDRLSAHATRAAADARLYAKEAELVALKIAVKDGARSGKLSQ
jgi:hypothetical protein